MLLRVGAGAIDPVFVGQQADDGRWFFGSVEVHPKFFAALPAFDCDEADE